jgi:3-hydroxyacyl-[acyl-carrier-protein] dehydratase
MATKNLIDLTTIDFSKIEVSKERILSLNAQRYEFEQLDRVVYMDLEEMVMIGVKEQKEDEFWVRGHIPSRPIMPGVLMIEMAAQVGSLVFHEKFDPNGEKFFGFGGVNNVKFRGLVLPKQTLVMVVKAVKLRSKIAVFAAQGFVDNNLVFEAEVTGIII